MQQNSKQWHSQYCVQASTFDCCSPIATRGSGRCGTTTVACLKQALLVQQAVVKAGSGASNSSGSCFCWFMPCTCRKKYDKQLPSSCQIFTMLLYGLFIYFTWTNEHHTTCVVVHNKYTYLGNCVNIHLSHIYMYDIAQEWCVCYSCTYAELFDLWHL